MNVNQKGVSGLIKVIDDLHEKGFYVFPAFDDHSPVDLIAMGRDGTTYRLQIKYKTEYYNIQASSVVNGVRIPIDRNLIDGWAVYLAKEKKVVYVNKELLVGKKNMTIDPNKNYGELAEWTKAAVC